MSCKTHLFRLFEIPIIMWNLSLDRQDLLLYEGINISNTSPPAVKDDSR